MLDVGGSALHLIEDYQSKVCRLFGNVRKERDHAVAAKRRDVTWHADDDTGLRQRVAMLANDAEDCLRAYERLRLVCDTMELGTPPQLLSAGEVYDERKHRLSKGELRRYYRLDNHRFLDAR